MTESTLDTQHTRKLPLHQEHEALGARMGVFGDWLVPLYYSSILEEHNYVRNSVGVFDICHMGEFYVRGEEASEQVNLWITNDVNKLVPGQALYSPVCRENGGIVDDIVVYKFSGAEYLLVVNAGNAEKDFSWFQSHLTKNVSFEDESEKTALLAVQGPKSPELIQAVFAFDLKCLSYYHFITFNSDFGNIILAETGYTGEKGFEIFCPIANVSLLWKRLFEAGKSFGLKPIGFGARDTLRLEAKLPLYGHDLSDETTPLEAGIGWTVGWNKKDFIGKRSLEAQRTSGIKRKLAGFEMLGRGIARQDALIRVGAEEAGKVTSGSFAPTLKKNIGLGYIAAEHSEIGQEIEIQIRDRWEKAVIVKTPFYKRSKETKK
jgi:aminomethyltransferase